MSIRRNWILLALGLLLVVLYLRQSSIGENDGLLNTTPDLQGTMLANQTGPGTGDVLLDFYADWCGPCRSQGKVLEEVVRESPNITVIKVNVDENPGLTSQFQVRGIPKLVALRDGKVIFSQAGLSSKSQVKAMFPPK